MDCLVRHDRDGTPLTNGKSVLERHHLSTQLAWACGSDSVAEVILTWHIATSILEVKCAPQSKDEVALSRVATRLSKYCAYLVAFRPELLPDNKEKAESVFGDMKAESTRVKRIMERAGEIRVETPGQDKAAEAGQSDENKVVLNGAKLAGDLLREGRDRSETVWKVLADVWTELIVFVAPSNEEERVKGHEQVLVQGGEFITVLWALTTHIGVTRPTPNKRSSTSAGGRL
jgi:hypothetical protein